MKLAEAARRMWANRRAFGRIAQEAQRRTEGVWELAIMGGRTSTFERFCMEFNDWQSTSILGHDQMLVSARLYYIEFGKWPWEQGGDDDLHSGA